MNTFAIHQIQLNGAQLSDLFFNHEHLNRDEVYKRYEHQDEAPSEEELEEAALSDATDFIAQYSIPFLEPETLAEDFNKRT